MNGVTMMFKFNNDTKRVKLINEQIEPFNKLINNIQQIFFNLEQQINFINLNDQQLILTRAITNKIKVYLNNYMTYIVNWITYLFLN